MPRTTSHPSPPVRRVPKTRGITTTGNCGHTFTDRYEVPHWSAPGGRLAGEPLTAPKVAVWFAEWEKTVRLTGTLQPCPDCVARATLATLRAGHADLARWLHAEPLPPLDGTARQAAYAERVRSQILDQALADVQWTAAWACSAPVNPVHALLLEGVRALYPDDPWLPDNQGNGLPGHAPTSNRLHQLAPSLALWLLLRRAYLQFADRARDYPEASYWLKRRNWNGRQAILLAHADYVRSGGLVPDVMAAGITDRLAWNTLDDAWEFFRYLTAITPAALLASLPRGQSLATEIEALAVETALTRPVDQTLLLPC